MTKAELIAKRDATYCPPPKLRCETCRHFSHYGNGCHAIEIRGKTVSKHVHAAGYCELHEARKESE